MCAFINSEIINVTFDNINNNEVIFSFGFKLMQRVLKSEVVDLHIILKIVLVKVCLIGNKPVFIFVIFDWYSEELGIKGTKKLCIFLFISRTLIRTDNFWGNPCSIFFPQQVNNID